LIQIRPAEGTAAQTASVESRLAKRQESTVKDLSTYALCYVALLGAALAVAGLIASTRDPAPPAPPKVAVQQTATHAAVTMNTPF
jgi:hypothetical protein